MSSEAFTPLAQACVNITASTTTANAALSPSNLKDAVLNVVNLSAAIAYVSWAASGAVATVTTGVPVAPNTGMRIRAMGPCGSVAAILSTGTGTVAVCAGEGL